MICTTSRWWSTTATSNVVLHGEARFIPLSNRACMMMYRLVLDLPVEMTEPTGAETIVLARLGGERTLARVAPDMRPEPGGSGRFALDMRRACLFDPATGALIA